MDITGKDITFAKDVELVLDDNGEILIPAGTRLIIDKATVKGGKVVLSVHEDREDHDGKR